MINDCVCAGHTVLYHIFNHVVYCITLGLITPAPGAMVSRRQPKPLQAGVGVAGLPESQTSLAVVQV